MNFSVIIPTYKGLDTLPIAIQSVLTQSFTDYEIIVSDDNEIGSNEQIETEKLVNDLKRNNPNVIYLKNGHHNGSYARNRGIKYSKGDIVTFLDDDDFYLRDYLKKSLDIFDSNNNIDVVFFDVLVYTKEKTIKKVSCPDISSRTLLFGEKEIGTGSNICLRKIVLDSLKFNEKYLRHQDIEFMTRVLCKHRFYWSTEAMVVKYYNKIDNYPHLDLALKMQKLLRDDMVKENIITEEQSFSLKTKQLHNLLHDYLFKNVPKNEKKQLILEIKKNNTYSLFDRILCLCSSMCPALFDYAVKKYINRKNGNCPRNSIDIIELRNRLIEESKR